MVSERVSRREFAGKVSVAVAAGLAGCGGFGNGAGNGTPTEDGTDGDASSPAGTETEDPEATEEPGMAAVRVRAVHAVVGGPAVDVYLDDDLAFERVAYEDVTGYTDLGAAATTVRVTAAGGEDQVLYEDELDVDEGGTFSVVAYGDALGLFAGGGGATPTPTDGTATATGTPGGEATPSAEEDEQQNDSAGQEDGTATPTGTPTDEPGPGGIQIAVLEDDVADAGGEDAALRVFHASPDAPAVNVVVAGGSEPLVSGVAYGEASDYATLEPGSRTLRIRPAREDDAVAEFTAEFEPGRAHTGYAVGYLESDDPDAETAFDLVGVVDGTGEAATGQAGQGGTGNGSAAGNGTSVGNESLAGNETSAGNDTSTA